MIRGEIWWENLPASSGAEPDYRRPALIIQSYSFNRSKINTVICAVITSNLYIAKVSGNVLSEKKNTNLPKTCVVVIVHTYYKFITEVTN